MALTPEQRARLDALAKQKQADMDSATSTESPANTTLTTGGLTPEQLERLRSYKPPQAQTNFSFPYFTISREEVTTGGPWTAAGYSLLAILIIALVFEIMRRVFYYVVLGSFRPEK